VPAYQDSCCRAAGTAHLSVLGATNRGPFRARVRAARPVYSLYTTEQRKYDDTLPVYVVANSIGVGALHGRRGEDRRALAIRFLNHSSRPDTTSRNDCGSSLPSPVRRF